MEPAVLESTQHGSLKVTKVPVKESGEHIYSVAYSHDGKFLAAVFGNGSLRIFNALTWAPVQRGKLGSGYDEVPSTSVKWRPPHPDSEEGVYELATVSSAGAVFGWNFDVSDEAAIYLDRTWKGVEEGNETAACDFSPNGLILATGGSDRIIRTYDPNTKKLLAKLERGVDDQGHTRPAHTNRIFSVRFASNTILLTGGWENPVQMWDMRTGVSERQLNGAQISSDGIEVTPGSQTVMTASKRDSKQIQVFDFLSGREHPTESDKLSANIGKNALSAVRYSPEGMIVWTVTTKPDVLYCVSSTDGSIKGCIDSGALGSVLCMERCPTIPNRLVVGSMKESLFVVELTQ